MLWPLKLFLAAFASAMSATVHPAPVRVHYPPANTKRRAERNVLVVTGRSWRRQAQAANLVNAASGQLRNNVQAICHGKGGRIGTRFHRFTCVVRTWPPNARDRLVVAYRARAAGGFRVHLVAGPRRHHA